jgi:hypothetical protein
VCMAVVGEDAGPEHPAIPVSSPFLGPFFYKNAKWGGHSLLTPLRSVIAGWGGGGVGEEGRPDGGACAVLVRMPN